MWDKLELEADKSRQDWKGVSLQRTCWAPIPLSYRELSLGPQMASDGDLSSSTGKPCHYRGFALMWNGTVARVWPSCTKQNAKHY